LKKLNKQMKKIQKDNIRGSKAASNAHFMVGGKVRQTIKDIGSETPESLPTEKHIKDVKKELKQLKKQEDKK